MRHFVAIPKTEYVTGPRGFSPPATPQTKQLVHVGSLGFGTTMHSLSTPMSRALGDYPEPDRSAAVWQLKKFEESSVV